MISMRGKTEGSSWYLCGMKREISLFGCAAFAVVNGNITGLKITFANFKHSYNKPNVSIILNNIESPLIHMPCAEPSGCLLLLIGPFVTNLNLIQKKCKEMVINFQQNRPDFAPILIQEQTIARVEKAIILGMSITQDLKWNEHVNKITKKAAKRLYLLKQLHEEVWS